MVLWYVYFSVLFRPQLLINHSLNNELQLSLSANGHLGDKKVPAVVERWPLRRGREII